jgi:hypothetical protein
VQALLLLLLLLLWLLLVGGFAAWTLCHCSCASP